MHPTLFLLPAFVLGCLAWTALDDMWTEYRQGKLGKTRHSIGEAAIALGFSAGFAIAIEPPISWMMGVVL